MGGFSIWHLLILAGVVVLLFGTGRVSDLMGDFAKGIKNFREGLKDTEEEERAKAAAAAAAAQRVLSAERAEQTRPSEAPRAEAAPEQARQ